MLVFFIGRFQERWSASLYALLIFGVLWESIINVYESLSSSYAIIGERPMK